MSPPVSFYQTFTNLTVQQRVYILKTLTPLQFKWIKEAFVNLVNNKDIVCPLSERNFLEKNTLLIKRIIGKDCASKRVIKANHKLVFKVIQCIVNHLES